MGNSIEEDMKILEGIIKGDEDCINAIYSQMKVKNDNDEDTRADKLEKEYSAMLTKSDEDECDYKRVLKKNEQLSTEVNSLKKDISNMYDEEVIISIISDNFNLSRNEVLKLLGGE